MLKQENLDVEKIEQQGRHDLAMMFLEALEKPAESSQQTVTDVREVAEYFLSVLRNEPRTKTEEIDRRARRDLAGEVRNLSKIGETPDEQIVNVRILLSQYL